MRYTVYIITNKINNHRYIGYTKFLLKKRFLEHLGDARRGYNKKLAQAIRKYGSENFEIMPISSSDSLELIKLFEQRVIMLFDTYKHGYNMTLGGDGHGPHTETHKEYMRQIMTGRVFSEETIKKMSLAKKGIPKSPEFIKNLGRPILYNKKQYDSITNCALQNNISRETVYNYLKQGKAIDIN